MVVKPIRWNDAPGIITAPRQVKLTFADVPYDRFLKFVNRHGRSDEAGPITSQYKDDPGKHKVGVRGFFACDQLIGLVSFTAIDLRLEPDTIGGRLDVVVVPAKVRGSGIGALLMAHLFDYFIKTYGDRLRSFSTVAVHPAVQAYVKRYGFEDPPPLARAPVYTVHLDDRLRVIFSEVADNEIRRRLYVLRQSCAGCRNREGPVWCHGQQKETA